MSYKYSSHQYRETEKKKTKHNSLKELFPLLPEEEYEVICADPAWDYGGVLQYNQNAIKKNNPNWKDYISVSASHLHYPTLKLSELKKLNVSSIASKNCLLFMWTTGPKMAESIELGDAWGFNYKTVAFVWDKKIPNPGSYTMSQCEYCLVFKKKGGIIPKDRGARNIRQLFSKRRTIHSEKPEEIAHFIEQMFPNSKKIELFARKALENWDFWGLEIDNKDKIFVKTDIT